VGAAARQATSFELIAQALAAGEIDEQEALQYRVLVHFQDSGVPQRYLGAPGGHDGSALATAARDLEDLRPEVRAAVEPFLLRPTDPARAFAGGTGTDASETAGTSTAGARESGPSEHVVAMTSARVPA